MVIVIKVGTALSITLYFSAIFYFKYRAILMTNRKHYDLTINLIRYSSQTSTRHWSYLLLDISKLFGKFSFFTKSNVINGIKIKGNITFFAIIN